MTINTISTTPVENHFSPALINALEKQKIPFNTAMEAAGWLLGRKIKVTATTENDSARFVITEFEGLKKKITHDYTYCNQKITYAGVLLHKEGVSQGYIYTITEDDTKLKDELERELVGRINARFFQPSSKKP